MLPTFASPHRFARRQLLGQAGAAATGFALTGKLAARSASAQDGAPPFDIFTGSAPTELIIPTIIPEVYGFVSPVASDATIVLRITTLVTHAWFDAIAPYHPTAVGVSSRIARRPASEASILNKNIAMLFASHRVLSSLLPKQLAAWDAMLQRVGLDPSDEQRNLDNPVGIGNTAGFSVAEERGHDGMNQLGDERGRRYNCRPYARAGDYVPVNTAYELTDPGRWQPRIMTTGNGIFVVQQLVTPDIATTTPYCYTDPGQFEAPEPKMSDPETPGYREQADDVLAVSAGLTGYQKLVAELFNDKFMGLGFSSLFAATNGGLSLDELVHYDFMTSMASFDTSIAVWKEKIRHDAVRPFSAIRWLYGGQPIIAWGGPGMGTVSDITGNEWESYLDTADHPEYPSGSASFCSAHAEASRQYFQSDEFGWSVTRTAGSSYVEAGVTPAEEIVLGPWETWTDFEEECGISRVWGGVHFRPSVAAGQEIGHQIGKLAYDFVQAHVAGEA